MDLYNTSNSITSYKVKFSAKAKKLYKEMHDGGIITEYKMNRLLQELSNSFDINSPYADYGGVEPHRTGRNGRLKSKIMGQYRTGGAIKIYMYTAKRKKLRANKATLNTLIHEFAHHLDFEYHKWHDSLHCKGFYHRITFITNKLLS